MINEVLNNLAMKISGTCLELASTTLQGQMLQQFGLHSFRTDEQSTYLKECFMVKNKPQSLPSTVRSKWVSIRRGCEPPCFQVGQRNLHPPQDPFTSWESTRHILCFLGRHSNDYRNAHKFETSFHLIWTAFQHITYLEYSNCHWITLSVVYN